MRVTTFRRKVKGNSRTHPTPRGQEFAILLEINHVVFVLLYLINISVNVELTHEKITPKYALFSITV